MTWHVDLRVQPCAVGMRRNNWHERPQAAFTRYGKLKLANLFWQTQVDMCERDKNSRQTSWQTVGNK